MKTKTHPVRLILATAVFGALASLVTAGPPSGGWQGTKQIKTFTDAKAVGPDATVAMACDKCKTVMLHETKHAGPQGKGPDARFVLGSKHTCGECEGEITIVKGKTTDSMQVDCSKCGEGSVHCSATLPAKK